MAARNPIITYLNAQQASEYIATIKNNNYLFELINKSFELKMDSRKGITEDEVNRIIQEITQVKNARP
jgi:hypothetical protein